MALPRLAIFIGAMIVLFLSMQRFVNVYDEGLILTGAMRAEAGDFIHRDFYANYGPGEFYLLSWLFKVFGERVAVERLLDLSVRAGIVVLIHVMTARYAGRWMAALAATLCLGWLATVGGSGYPVYPAVLCAMASTWLVVQTVQTGQGPWKSVLAGLLAGGVTFFRYDVGVATVGAHVAFAVCVALAGRRAPHARGRAPVRDAVLYALGVGLPVGGLMLTFALGGAMPDFIHDIVSYPSKYYVAMRATPFPALRGEGWRVGFTRSAIYLPPAIVGAILCAWAVRRRTPMPAPARDAAASINVEAHRFVLACLLLASVYFFKGVVRVGVDQMQLSLFPAVVALAVHVGRMGRPRMIDGLALGVLALTAMAVACNVDGSIRHSERVLWDTPWLMGYATGKEGFVIEKTAADRLTDKRLYPLLKIEPDRDAALDYLVRHSRPGEPVFIGLAHHDRVFINDVSAYFLAHRLPATKWHHFDPGLQNSKPVQEEMIADLERHKTPWVWTETTWESVREPNGSAISSGVELLDDYIGAHYETVRTFGKIRLMHRR